MVAYLLKGNYFFGVFLFFIQSTAIYGQHDYIIQHYTNENGLPANGVKGIELDKTTGYLWIGTQAGLARFDGTQFMRFSSAKDAEISFRISFIARNREGTIYSADDNFSVYRVEQNKPVFVTSDTFLIGPSITFGQRFSVNPLLRLVGELKKNLRSSFLPSWITYHEEAGDSSSFSLLYFSRAYHYDATLDSLFEFSGFDNMLKLEGHIYFSRPNLELWEYDKNLKTVRQVEVKGMPVWKGNEKPRFIWAQGMHEPLLVYGGDIWKLQQSGNGLRLSPLCHECCPSDPDILSIQVWKERGLIFLGSGVNGLYVVKRAFLRSIPTDTITGAGKAEYAQGEIDPGIIYTSQGLAVSADGRLRHKSGITFHRFVFYRDRQRHYWSSSNDTITRFHPITGRYHKIPLNDGSVRTTFAETQNSVYAISDRAIYRMTDDRYSLLYKLPPPGNDIKKSLSPDNAIEWKPGLLAIAGEKLLLFDTNSKSLDTIHILNLNGKVRALLKYGDYLLIGTYGQGFYMYKNGRVKKMPLDRNGYLSYAHCFVNDNKGFCWISTNHGLFKTSLNALVAAFENNLPEIYYQYFGKDDGVFNTEFNGGCEPCALQLSDSSISFPSMNGLVIFDPGKPHALPPAGNIFTEEIRIDTIYYQPGDSSLRSLPYNVRNLRFALSVPQFGNQENIYFSYKLEPYSNQWETQDIRQNNILQFGGLKPGAYKLHMRVRNGFEPNQFGTSVVEFRILKPWYQEWWFYLFCLFGLAALISGLIKWKTANIAKRKKELQKLVEIQTGNLAIQSKQLEAQLQQLIKQQEELEDDNLVKARLISIISHDMISPLKFMAEGGKELRDAFPTANPLRSTAESIVNITVELETLSANMLNWIRFHHKSYINRSELFDIRVLVNESIEIPSMLAARNNVQVYNDVAPKISLQQNRQAIGVIIYNLVMNAVKHTYSGEIHIASGKSGKNILLTINDTGSGMPPDLVERLNSSDPYVGGYVSASTKKHQFGFVIIKDLLKLVGGTMTVKSAPDSGTTVCIELQEIKEKIF